MLLGVILDKDLQLDVHILSPCGIEVQKLGALSRIIKYLTFDQKLLILDSALNSQFTYCSLI